MLSIGITGGIGSGKSTVCSILEHLGYPVFYADKAGREVSDQNPDVRAKIKALFGNEAYKGDVLNRQWVAQRVFSDASLKEKLNAVIHPAVFEAYENWKKLQNSDLVFNESALLFETGSYKRFDAIVLVTADEELRIKRVMERDGISREQILARMKQQLPDLETVPAAGRKQKAHFVITNNTSDLLLPQVLEMIRLLKLADAN